jgi:hypothetical protein
MKIKHVVKTDLTKDNLLSFDSLNIWLGDEDHFEYKGFCDAFRQGILRTKVNIHLLTLSNEELESRYQFQINFYFGIFYRRMTFKKI